MQFFANFDHFSKSKKHVQVRTYTGATISLASLTVMVILFISELVYWRSTRVEDHILVDKSLGDRQVEIEIELHFHALPCSGAWTFLQLPSPSLPPPCPLPGPFAL